MSSLKLSLNHLTAFIIGTFVLGFVVFAGRIGFEAVQKSVSVDESNIVSGSAFLDKSSLKKAINIIDGGGQSKTGEKMVEENKTDEVNSGKSIPKKVEIINASGINGAASRLGSMFDENITELLLRNGEELLDETSIFYKNEYKDWKNDIEKELENMEYKDVMYGELEEGNEVDIRIILGQKAS